MDPNTFSGQVARTEDYPYHVVGQDRPMRHSPASGPGWNVNQAQPRTEPYSAPGGAVMQAYQNTLAQERELHERNRVAAENAASVGVLVLLIEALIRAVVAAFRSRPAPVPVVRPLAAIDPDDPRHVPDHLVHPPIRR